MASDVPSCMGGSDRDSSYPIRLAGRSHQRCRLGRQSYPDSVSIGRGREQNDKCQADAPDVWSGLESTLTL